jgi:hypothetical protein
MIKKIAGWVLVLLIIWILFDASGAAAATATFLGDVGSYVKHLYIEIKNH